MYSPTQIPGLFVNSNTYHVYTFLLSLSVLPRDRVGSYISSSFGFCYFRSDRLPLLYCATMSVPLYIFSSVFFCFFLSACQFFLLLSSHGICLVIVRFSDFCTLTTCPRSSSCDFTLFFFLFRKLSNNFS